VLHNAIGDRMIGIFIDNGLLRKNEAAIAKKRFELLKIPVNIVDASHDFLIRLQGVVDPEQKRRIIGDTFVDVFKQYSQNIADVSIFAQGTLYPDVVESGGSIGPSSVIKTHHNLVDEVKQMGFKIIEPFRELFKDEVRKIGSILSIPEEVIKQHPFPGPGLAVRMIGEITPERLALLREVDAILIEEVKTAGYYDALWQCFPVLLPVKTVGVMGDQRSYSNVIAIRAIKSLDGMTADWVLMPYEVLNRISSRIVNEIKGINRVVYDITNKPPATIEWE
jgi:GMP synthase (glutamine-hydrolysing)